MSKMLERIKAAQNRLEQQNSFNDSGEKEEIFFKLEEGEHQIRLVGDGWVTIHSHYYNTKFSELKLFPDSAFTGENHIKKISACADFDPDTEMNRSEKKCVLCKLRKAANDILYGEDSSSLSSEQKELLGSIAKEAAPTERYFFLCIDRKSPEIAPGKKGLKIIEFPKNLMKQFLTFADKNSDIELFDDEEGVDLIITKKRDSNKWVYTIDFVRSGRTVAPPSPLTDEEKAYQKHDIKKIMGKVPSQKDIYENLILEFQDMVEFDEEEEEEEEEPQKEEKKMPSIPKKSSKTKSRKTEDEDDIESPF